MSDFFCPNQRCTDYGRRGRGNIAVSCCYGKDRTRLLRCRTCNLKFSERRTSFFFGLHTKETKIREVISCVLGGMSYREAADYVEIDKDTVQRIWNRFLKYCEESIDDMLGEFNVRLEDLALLLARRPGRLGNRSS